MTFANFGSGLKTGKNENRAKEYNFMIAGFYILDFLFSLVMKKHKAKWSDCGSDFSVPVPLRNFYTAPLDICTLSYE